MDSPGNNGVVQTPAHGGDAERRGVTILFADMADYTATVERIGEEGAYDLMRPIYGLMAKIVRREGGVVKDFTGDGIMAVFGAPVALEDATLRACRAALGIQAEVAGLAADFHGRLGVRPRLRVGVNAGPGGGDQEVPAELIIQRREPRVRAGLILFHPLIRSQRFRRRIVPQIQVHALE